jgi:ABC-2 type transport system ATP-binding protein
MSGGAVSHDCAVQVEGITKVFGPTRALDNVSLEVGLGEICALLGPNGAGKTTLIKIMTGLIPADSGRVTSSFVARRSRTGWFSYLPEESGLYERMRLDELILFFGRLSGMSGREVAREMPWWLERFKIREKTKARIVSLSKGNQQKVKLICALINRPPLLVLDEPFTGLDGDTSELLRQSLAELRREGTTTLMSSHRLDQVEILADRIVILTAGKKILDATPKEARKLFRQSRVEVSFSAPPPDLTGLPGVVGINWVEETAQLALDPQADPAEILAALVARGCRVEHFVRHTPNLGEIIQAAGRTLREGGA